MTAGDWRRFREVGGFRQFAPRSGHGYPFEVTAIEDIPYLSDNDPEPPGGSPHYDYRTALRRLLSSGTQLHWAHITLRVAKEVGHAIAPNGTRVAWSDDLNEFTVDDESGTQRAISWAKVKRRQADDAEKVAETASGIGEYGIANACYRLAELLRQQAKEYDTTEGGEEHDRS